MKQLKSNTMKKTLIIAALAFFGMANAQKGTILVGGNVYYNTGKNSVGPNENKSNYFEFAPMVGYQFTDKWTAGIVGGIASQKNENTSNLNPASNTEQKQNDFKIGAFGRYTIPLGETFAAFAQLEAGYQGRKDEDTSFNGFFSTTTTSKASGFFVGITPALFINMNKGFGLNFGIGGIGYETLNYDNNGGDFSQFNISFGQSFNIGISKNF